MKLIMFDFLCPKGHLFEELVQPEIKHEKCPECGRTATRQVSAGHLDYLHMGIDAAGMPTAGAKWAKMQWQKARTDKGSISDGAPNLRMY